MPAPGQVVGTPGRADGRDFLTPGDERHTPVPARPGPGWINGHASFVYLAAGLIAVGQDANDVVLHTRLNEPFDTAAAGPVVVLAYTDGHTGVLPVADARRAIARSVKGFDAQRAAAKAVAR